MKGKRMQVRESGFIGDMRDACARLSEALCARFPYASVLLQDTKSARWSVSAAGVSMRVNPAFTGRGAVIRVNDGSGYGEYALSGFSVTDIPAIIARLTEMTPLPGSDPAPEMLEALSFHKSTTCEIDPEEMGGEKIIARLTELRAEALKMDERLLDCMFGFDYQVIHKRFVAGGRALEQDLMWSSCMINCVARRGDEVKECYRTFSMLGGAEILDRLPASIGPSVDGVIALLDSGAVEPGVYDCVCAPPVTGIIAHEAFGHGVEMDMFVKKRAQAEAFLGERIASPMVTMHDTASAAAQTGSYFFDDEGTLAGDTVIIKDGVLMAGMCDFLSAQRLGAKPTGNGRRESFERKAYARMTNTFFEGGADSVDDMIASIEDGFLLESSSSGMEDPKNWGIQLMVDMAREIKGGKLTGRVFSPVVLTGYVPDLLKSISMMSPAVELSGAGACGKGYKEWAKVSDGGPYIKARIRLG
jgi:TldD protein